MRTALYARISEDRQDGAGVARQLADCRALASRKNWAPLVEFVDNDISASAYSRKVRTAYRRMLEGAREGELERIVVYHIDRLYRQPRELEDWIDLADQGRVEIVSANSGDIDLANSDGRAMARVLVAMAAKESDDKSRRIKRAKQHSREQGLPHGGRRAFGWRDGMTQHPEEAPVIQQAVTDLLSGASMAEVTRRWNAAGVVQPQTGKARWTPANVRQVMMNPRHAGLVGYRAEVRDRRGRRTYARPVVIGTAQWPAIVPRDRWERLQAVLSDRGASGRIPRRRSLLTGLITCAACGTIMVRTGGHRRSSAVGSQFYRTWRCPNQRGCGRVSIQAQGLEALIVETVKRATDTVDLVAAFRGDPSDERQATDLLHHLDELDHRLDAAAAAYAHGKLPARAFEKAGAAIQREQAELRAQLSRLSARAAVEPYVGEPGLLRVNWPRLTVDQQRAIVGAVIETISVRPAIQRGRPSFDEARVEVRWRGRGSAGTQATGERGAAQ